MAALWVAGAAGGLAQTLLGVAATLVAAEMAGNAGTAGFPQALQVLGAAGFAPVVSRWSSRTGRGIGLAIGATVGAAGGAVSVAAVALHSVPLLLLGSFLGGGGATAVALARYAAVEVGGHRGAGRAVSSVLAAVAVGAVVGPNLLAPTVHLDRLVGLPRFSTGFLLATVVFLVAGAVWAIGAPRGAIGPAPAGVRWAFGRSAFAVAVLGLANLVMVATMTMVPVQLHHIGGGLGSIGIVVGVHIAAMFAPAPISGWVVDRFGIGHGAAVACGTLLAATSLAALSAGSVWGLLVAVALLGFGWSAAVVTGSAALVRWARPEERPRLEAAGEVGMGVAAAVGGAASGLVVGVGGYATLATLGAACVAVGLVPLCLRLSTLVPADA
ncbi:MFS transporter [Cryptosporangium minutisporangium]|uniref:MFS transporter n=1 Tax=Cryptosporangium minutisporangium TaxID=113569 RepID=A0ABP6T7B9_9ACTN